MPLDVMPGGFNPMSLPPVRREWGGGMANSSGGNTPGNLPSGMVNSSGPGRGNLPPMGPMGGGGMQSMMRPPMGGGFGGGYGGGQGMVQGPSFMQQQPQRNRMAGGMIDPSWRMKMSERAASTGSTPAEKVRLAGEGRADPLGWAAKFQRMDNPQPQQNMGMGGGDPMQMFMQMMPFWQMYSQMLGNRGQQGY